MSPISSARQPQALHRELLDRARHQPQSVDQCQRGYAIPNGQGSNSWPAASFAPQPDLIEGNVSCPHCKNRKDRDAEYPES
ncbi:hypothetical protein J2X01_000323 [Arthrobacter ginsengisoli]|uniref:Uncharacterized protein n=1 Tax=Arthrobacter ginsengisoli TaxID=1356565 RepID=A0ABU1U786_9MICC|nr:hypothetical protein [Arthrobacter ginsengisoli]